MDRYKRRCRYKGDQKKIDETTIKKSLDPSLGVYKSTNEAFCFYGTKKMAVLANKIESGSKVVCFDNTSTRRIRVMTSQNLLEINSKFGIITSGLCSRLRHASRWAVSCILKDLAHFRYMCHPNYKARVKIWVFYFIFLLNLNEIVFVIIYSIYCKMTWNIEKQKGSLGARWLMVMTIFSWHTEG